MKIYCMSDIHGCLAPFEKALEMVLPNLEEQDTMLLLLGDYIHRGVENRSVLDKIITLQELYGREKVLALRGNHEDFVIDNLVTLDDENIELSSRQPEGDQKYIEWTKTLPLFYVSGKTIFVHAGIDEDAGEYWEYMDEGVFTMKYPPSLKRIQDIDKKVVAGHVGTCEIAGDKNFHNVYYDGKSHYYIDGTVNKSGYIPVLLVDTEEDAYYEIIEGRKKPVRSYG